MKRISGPKFKLRSGLIVPKDYLAVDYRRTVGLPWKEVRPMVACAFRHVRREAARDLGPEYVRRAAKYRHTLVLGKSKQHWWGRAVGYTARVFMGKLHTEPRTCVYPRFKDMPVYWVRDWQEHLVGLIAHELWHRWQPGSGKAAEHMCELVEWDAIDRWRKEQGYVFTPPETPHPDSRPVEAPTELVPA